MKTQIKLFVMAALVAVSGVVHAESKCIDLPTVDKMPCMLEEANQAEALLTATLKQVGNNPGVAQTQATWQVYVNQECALEGAPGGSQDQQNQADFLSCKIDVTNERVARLQHFILH